MWPIRHCITTSGSDTPPTAICAAVSGNTRPLYRTRHGVVGGLAVPFSMHRVLNTPPMVHPTDLKRQLKRLAHLGRVCNFRFVHTFCKVKSDFKRFSSTVAPRAQQYSNELRADTESLLTPNACVQVSTRWPTVAARPALIMLQQLLTCSLADLNAKLLLVVGGQRYSGYACAFP